MKAKTALGESYPFQDKRRISVAVFARLPLLSEGLRSVFARHGDIRLVAEGHDGGGAMDLLRRKAPRVVLLETSIAGRDPIEATREMSALTPAPRVIVFSLEDAPHYALRLIRAGARGFLPGSAGSREIVVAIRSVDRGGVYLSPSIQEMLADRLLEREQAKLPEELLTDREFEVMRHLAQGYTNREIGQELFISVKTVDTHRANMLRKLSLRNNADVTRFAIHNGFVRC